MEFRELTFCKLVAKEPELTVRKLGDCAEAAGYKRENYKSLMEKEEIINKIVTLRDDIIFKADINPVQILREWYAIAFSNVGNVVKPVRQCCRYCYGVGHAYQWTQAEYLQASEKAIQADKPAPECLGGFGFNASLLPAKDCPECCGNGIIDVEITPFNELDGPHRRLYSGIEKRKDGSIKLITRNQDDALTKLAQYMGMLKGDMVIINNGVPEQVKPDPKTLTDEQLNEIIARESELTNSTSIH